MWHMGGECGTSWPVLLTATITPDPLARGQIKDPSERRQEYMDTLRWMAKARTDVNVVVFSENSGADLQSFHDLVGKYAKKGRILEIARVPMPLASPFRGKGWGEGLIMEWALQHVDCLAEADAFIKITGRLQILNLARIIETIKITLASRPDLQFVCEAFFLKNRSHIHTQFFWSRRLFYETYLSDVYDEVNDDEECYLEHVIARRLIAVSRTADIGILPLPLVIRGRAGWNGETVMTRGAILREQFRQAFHPLPKMLMLSEAMHR